MQIIVLGMHRSGTSLTTRLVNMMGAYVGAEGKMIGYAADNPKGFWERLDVLRANEELLALNDCFWSRLARWSPSRRTAMPPKLRHHLQNILLQMDAHRPWVMKDPRLCITLPYWKPLLEAPVALVVYRDPLEVALSLRTRDDFPVEYGLALWEYYVVNLLNATADIPRLHASHSDALSDPVAFTHSLYEALCSEDIVGLRQPSAKEITAFIEPSLYRSRANDEAGGPRLTPHQEMLAAHMRGEEPQSKPLQVSTSAAAIMREAERHWQEQQRNRQQGADGSG